MEDIHRIWFLMHFITYGPPNHIGCLGELDILNQACRKLGGLHLEHIDACQIDHIVQGVHLWKDTIVFGGLLINLVMPIWNYM